MTEPAVEIKTRLDTEAAKKEAQSFASELLGRIQPTIDVANVAAKAYEIFGRAIGVVTGFIKDGIAGAAESQVVQTKLATALKATGDATGAVYGQLAAYNVALLRKIGLDDDDSAALQTKLLALGVQQNQLEAATRATIGLAEATGKELSAAAKQVAREFKSGGEDVEHLQNLFSLATSKAETFTGRLGLLQAQVGALAETAGGYVVENEEVNASLGRLQSTVEVLNGKLKDQSGALETLASAAGKTTSVGASLLAIYVEIETKGAGMLAWLANQNAFVRALGQGWGFVADQVIRFADSITREDLDRIRSREIAGFGKSLIEAGQKKPEPEDWWNQQDEPSGGKGGRLSAGEIGRRFGIGKKGRRTTAPTKSTPKAFSEDDLSFEANRILAGPTDAELLEEQLAEEERLLDIKDQARLAHLDAEIEREDFYAKMRREQQAAELEAQKQFYGQLTSIGATGLAGFFGVLGAAIDGNNVGEGLERLLAGIGQQIGAFLIATGSAAVAGGILGTAVPIFGAVLGGPAAIAAGAGLIAAGGLLAGFSASAGANIGGGPAPNSAASRPPSFGGSDIPGGFTSGPSGGAQTTVINVSMGRGWTVGTERGVALEIYELIRHGLSLSPRSLDPRFG